MYFGVFLGVSGFSDFCDPSHAKPLFLRAEGCMFSYFFRLSGRTVSRIRFVMIFHDFRGFWEPKLDSEIEMFETSVLKSDFVNIDVLLK